MSEYKSQVQNEFLKTVRKRHQHVEVVLDTGTSLRGIIKGFDQFSITIGFHDKLEVIYKSAILYVTALPRRPMNDRRPGPPGRPYGMDSGHPPAPLPPVDRVRPPLPRFDPDEREDKDPPPPRRTPTRRS